ncbi:MAG: hypothetical protein ACXW4E_05330, partial [Anaerolineales bacterium]
MKQRACLFIHTAVLRRASLVFIVVAACQSPAPPFSPTLPPTQVLMEAATPSPVPTITLTPSPTPTIEEWISSFTIDGLRQHDFHSGKINIRSTLSENDKFTTYL